jgi:hypothetical protein
MTPALQTAITNAYPIGAFGTSNEFEVIAQIFTDLAIGCVRNPPLQTSLLFYLIPHARHRLKAL